MTILGVDVSHHQGSIDWARAKAAGVVFGLVKSTDFTDPLYRQNTARMKAAGVVPGAYHPNYAV